MDYNGILRKRLLLVWPTQTAGKKRKKEENQTIRKSPIGSTNLS